MSNDKQAKKELPERLQGKRVIGETNRASSSSGTNKKEQPPVKEIHINLNKVIGNVIIFMIAILVFLPFLFQLINGGVNREIPLSEFVNDLRNDKIKSIEVAGDEIRAEYKLTEENVGGLTAGIGSTKKIQKEQGQQLLDILNAARIDLAATEIVVRNLSFWKVLGEVAVSVILPLVAVGIVFFLVMKNMRGGGMDIMGIGKSKAKVFIKGKQDVKFADVGGMEEAKAELEEIVDFLKNPKKYQKVGARTPKGLLLVGPAGTGKTLLARAVAGEANVQFLSIAGSEFMEMLVGVGASRVRDLFDTAKKLAPAIIFIDEIDVIGRTRGQGQGGGQDEREQTLNQILVEMDGFSKNDNVIVIAATNRADMLDQALVRPGRFDRRVQVNLPDLEERKYILRIHAKGKPFEEAVDWEQVARNTTGYSGADLENMLNEAAIAIVRENKEKIGMEEIDEAAIKVKMGPSKKRILDEEERKMTAYHEIGHAIVAHYSKYADKVAKISIISRGSALGYTMTPPEKDRLQTTKSELVDDMAVMLGGRVVEEIIFDEQTAGASSDIERATRIARAMVEDLGMSELGVMYYGPQYENDYSRSWWEPRKISSELQHKVDLEIKKFLDSAYTTAKKIINDHRIELDAAAERLLEVETMDGVEFASLMKNDKARR